MTGVIVRRAGDLDCRAMAGLLNEIIKVGGTTAYVNSISAQQVHQKYAATKSIWHVAETQTGELLGFQWLEPHPDLDEQSLDINSFVKVGSTGLGVGSALFAKTRLAAIQQGAHFLHAIIRADNNGGLAYYQSRGFASYQRLPNQTLDDGSIVDKIWMRYDLTL